MKTIAILTALIVAGALAAGLRPFGGSLSAAQEKGKTMTTDKQNLRTATFAGGCFWCTEADFEKVPGVVEAVSGYTGGSVVNPTYEQVSGGGTGHVEAIQVLYDATRTTYDALLEVFWRHVDPTDAGGQFVDRGDQYASAIFYHDEEQRRQAEASKAALAASGRFDRPIVTPIEPAGVFYRAEEYHQDYYKNNPLRYTYYRYGSGRDQFLKKVWKEDSEQQTAAPIEDNRRYSRPSDDELRRRLDKLQFEVTQENGTEPPFDNAYWNNKHEGIYVDVVSGEPLFSSLDKYDSGTGWPSFTRPLNAAHVVEVEDRSLFMVRTEVRSRYGEAHLGHLFDDGPAPTGQRYCINSAALRFIPREDLEKEGYGAYAKLFEK